MIIRPPRIVKATISIYVCGINDNDNKNDR